MQTVFQMVNENLTTIINLLFNVGIIPIAVSTVTMFDDHKTLAKREIAIMNRMFFFLMIIALFLPLVGQTVILTFIEELSQKITKLEDWTQYLGKNLVNGFGFFLYTIQAAFISNGMLLLDTGHQFMRWFKLRMHNAD